MNDEQRPELPAATSASLAAITAAMTTSLDVAAIFGVVAQETAQILPYAGLALMLLGTPRPSAPTRDLSLAFCQPALLEQGRSWPLEQFSFAAELLAGRAAVIADFRAQAGKHPGDQALLGAFGPAGVVVPIRVASHVLGSLVLVSPAPGAYGPATARLIEPIASLLALALEHQRLDQQASALAVVEERNRLAREIHDTLAQSLAGIIINLEALKPYAVGRAAADAEVLAETETLARGALEEARRSVLGLHPTPLQHQALAAALAPELVSLAKRAGVATQFYLHGQERPLAPDIATALFRVAQEAFQNIYKHASARHTILGLAFEEAAVVLTVEDDGVGFVPTGEAPQQAGGFGLLSMAARARSLGGDLGIRSQPGHGTAIRATVPYARPPAPAAVVVLPGEEPAQHEPDAPRIRLLIVDDQPLTRQGIQRILEKQPDIEVVGEAADGLGAVAQTASLRPDVVLLDLQMPGRAGVAALPRLRQAHPGVQVVILTMFDQDEEVFTALKAGARGYVLKDAPPETMIAAIRAASRKQSALAPRLTTRLIERFSALAQREVDPNALTERELEVLNCMERGWPYKQIAAQLNISTHTVQYHVTNILQKLGARSRSEAVAAARQRGLLSAGR